jgi:hypothetical protein
MTNFTTRMMIAAATVVVAAGAASAQTLKAEIPFTFRANGAVMAAGTYKVSQISHTGTPIFQVRGDTGQGAVLLVPLVAGDPDKSWVAKGMPVLSFACGPSRCALAQIWAGGPAYTIRQVDTGKDEPVRVALIEMRSVKSE